MQPGQILVNANGEERKILFVSGDLIIPSKIGNFDMASSNYTKKELEKFGWSLLEEPWVPRRGDLYYVVIHIGKEKESIKQNYWYEDKTDEFRLSMGNVHRTREDAELYKQKLIERMGKK
jgi:hypothetical protein